MEASLAQLHRWFTLSGDSSHEERVADQVAEKTRKRERVTPRPDSIYDNIYGKSYDYSKDDWRDYYQSYRRLRNSRRKKKKRPSFDYDDDVYDGYYPSTALAKRTGQVEQDDVSGALSGYGHKVECCPLVVKPLVVLSLLGLLAFATFFLNILITMNITMRRRRRRRKRTVAETLSDLAHRGT